MMSMITILQRRKIQEKGKEFATRRNTFIVDEERRGMRSDQIQEDLSGHGCESCFIWFLQWGEVGSSL